MIITILKGVKKMKVYQICEILNTDSVYVNDSDNNMLLHIEGENAVNAVAQLYEHCTVKRVHYL